jgi:hypothetical protein
VTDAGKLGAVAVAGIYATFALDCYSTFCSSPQTTELNAAARADTLMKWVTVGGGAAVGGGLLATIYSGDVTPLLATIAIAALMYWCYAHAKKVGLSNGGPATESY